MKFIYIVKVITVRNEELTQYFTNLLAAQDYEDAARSHSSVNEVFEPNIQGVVLNRGLNISSALDTLDMFARKA